MKRVVRFTKIRYIMFLFSIIVIVGGIIGTVHNGGYNLGIDFQAGLNQRVQIAPVGVEVAYSGKGDASVEIQGNVLTVVLRGEKGVEKHSFNLKDAGTIKGLADKLNSVTGVKAEVKTNPDAPAVDIVAGLNYPLQLSKEPSYLNIKNADESNYVTIDKIRSSLTSLGNPQVQVVGKESNQEFQIRVGDPEGNMKRELENKIVNLLETSFGSHVAVVKQSDYVGPKFSSTLARASISLTLTALVLVLVYLWFRFKLAFGVSAIIALFHDVLIMLGFIGTFRLEVSTTTIAAVLTIIGYSLNDTIVVFDRIRENTGLLKGEKFSRVVDISITQSLSRTIITSLTTLIAVLALYFFGTGSIKGFALNLIIGIVAGTYSSIFIASPILLGWVNVTRKRELKKSGVADKIRKVEEKSVEHGESLEIKRTADIPTIERKKKGKRKKKK